MPKFGNPTTVDAEVNTDDLEAKIDTANTHLTTIESQTEVEKGTGVDTAFTQRVSLATDIPLPAGTNGIGKLTANSGVDIGDVDVTSVAAGENHLGAVGGHSINPSATFTRPADTTAYASGDLMANSTTASSVAALAFTAARVEAGSFVIRRVRMHKDNANLALATFRLHLFKTDPTATDPTGGDNAALELNSLAAGSYIGYVTFDFTMAAVADIQASDIELPGVPAVGTEFTVKLASGQIVYGLLEARAAYVPASAEVFTFELEVLQD